MKHTHHIWGILIILALPVLSFVSCNGGADLNRLIEERDSLRDLSAQQTRRLSRLDTLISSINVSLDTIASGEAGIFVNGVSEATDKKGQILGNISRLSTLIEKQRAQIELLEKRYVQSEDEEIPDDNIRRMIDNFKRQLADKDKQIAALKEEISRKDADISRMSQRIGLQTQTIAELDKRNAAQTEALKRQDAMLNHCYMAIGTKKELEKKGIIKKGKVQPNSSFDRSNFAKVDIRTFTEIQFNAKRPRILTPMPSESYSLTTDGNKTYTLHITNPTNFWKVSNYLVIQTE